MYTYEFNRLGKYSQADIANNNDAILSQYIKSNNLIWNSWNRYPFSVFVDKNNKHFGVLEFKNNQVYLSISPYILNS